MKMKKLIFLLVLTFLISNIQAQVKVEVGPQFGGPMSDDFRSTIGGDINVNYMLTSQIAIGATMGYHHIIMADNWKEIWYEKWGTVYTDANYNLMPIRATFTYYFNESNLKPYLGFEAGMNKKTGYYTYYYDSYYGDERIDDSETSFAFAGQAGLEIGLGKACAIDLNLKYNSSNLSYISGKIGLVFTLGNK